jgi:hypothetical protein
MPSSGPSSGEVVEDDVAVGAQAHEPQRQRELELLEREVAARQRDRCVVGQGAGDHELIAGLAAEGDVDALGAALAGAERDRHPVVAGLDLLPRHVDAACGILGDDLDVDEGLGGPPRERSEVTGLQGVRLRIHHGVALDPRGRLGVLDHVAGDAGRLAQVRQAVLDLAAVRVDPAGKATLGASASAAARPRRRIPAPRYQPRRGGRRQRGGRQVTTTGRRASP